MSSVLRNQNLLQSRQPSNHDFETRHLLCELAISAYGTGLGEMRSYEKPNFTSLFCLYPAPLSIIRTDRRRHVPCLCLQLLIRELHWGLIMSQNSCTVHAQRQHLIA